MAPVASSGASTFNTFQIVPSPNSQVSISSADESACNLAAGTTTDESIQTLRKFAVIVTNNSPLSVTALTIVWRLSDPTGHIAKQTFLSDSYVTPKLASVIPPHGQAMLWPLVMYLHHDDGSWTNHIFRPNPSLARRFLAAVSITATIDLVATSDGQYSGDDTAQTIAGINSRKQAANEIAHAFRQAQASGRSLDDVVAQIKTASDPARTPLDKWKQRFSGTLSRSVALRESFVRYLEALPEAPQFRQNTTSSTATASDQTQNRFPDRRPGF